MDLPVKNRLFDAGGYNTVALALIRHDHGGSFILPLKY
jgi:hypothetical protein